MQEAWVWSLGWEGLLEEDPLQYSCLENPMDRGVWQATVQWVTKSQDTTEHSRTRAWDVLREHSCLIICIKPDFALLCCSTFSRLIIKDECGRVRAGLYITFIDKSSYKRVCVVNRDWNNFPGSRLETPFPQYSKESLSTVTTPLFVKLINCIWYSVCVSGHYSLTSLPKPVYQLEVLLWH